MADPGHRRTLYDSLGAHDAQQQQQVHKPPPLPRQNAIPKPPPSPTHAPQFTVSFNLWDWLEYYERPLVWFHMAIMLVLLALLLRLVVLRAKKEIVNRFKAWWNRPWKSDAPQSSPQPHYDYGAPPYSGGAAGGPNYGYGSTGYSTGYTTPNTPQQYGPSSGQPRWNTSTF
jgi:hypothetical protein